MSSSNDSDAVTTDGGRVDDQPDTTEPVELELAGELTIAGVVALAERLTKAAGDGKRFVVDTTGVDNVDTAGLQMLVAFSNSVHTQNGDVAWRLGDSPVGSAAERAGIAAHFATEAAATTEVDEDDGLCPVF